MDGERPARPQEAQELGLTDPMWDMTIRCWDQDPAQRPTMIEVIGLLWREAPAIRVDADLSDFFQVYKTWDKDNQGKMAQQFADKLDEVCRTEGHNIPFSHHTSRFLTIQISMNKNPSI